MKPSQGLQSHRAEIRCIVLPHRAESDLDILIDPTPETTFFNIGALRHESLGVPVDVLPPKALPDRFRATVLAEALPR